MSEILKRIHPTKARLLQQDLNDLRDHIADQDDFGAEMLDDNPGDYDHNGPILSSRRTAFGPHDNPGRHRAEGSQRVAGSGWDDHPDYPRKDWQYEVGNGDTHLSYPDWVEQQKHYNDQPSTYEDRGPGGLADIDDHPDYPRKDWQYEVGNGDTWQGYPDWVKGRQQDDEDEAQDWGHLGSRTAADPAVTAPVPVGGTVSTSIPGALAKLVGDAVIDGSTMTGQEDAHMFNPGPSKVGAMRIAAINFLAGQNTRDRSELLFRAHRHASDRTGQLPVPTAQRTVQAFVAAVNREILAAGSPQDEACDACNAEAGEDCRPWCVGKAAHDDETADRKKKSHRTAAVIADFDDTLLFGG